MLGEKRESRALDRSVGLADSGQKIVGCGSRKDIALTGVDRRPLGIVKIEHRGLSEERTRAAVRCVSRIPFKLRRPTLMRLGQQRDRGFPERHRGRKVLRQTRNHAFNGFAEGKNVLLGPAATGETETAQSERGRHELHEASAIYPIESRRALGKLASQVLLKAWGGRKFVETAPITGPSERAFGRGGMVKFAFHRWQPEQLCGGLIFQSWTNFSPASTPALAAMV